EEVEAVEELALEGEAADEVDLGNVWAEEPDEMGQERDWAEEPEEPALLERGAEPPVFTRTMADLYARQGHVGRALKIYHRLLDRHPDDEALRDRIRELEEEATASAETGRTISSYFESLIGWESET
ncbi:MAG: tetratricopeptide repeat protein, partial [Longimicrobiales bacterium]|nr:tetratricopeptide repeat protein [Longimicrobiales bacterium]